MRRHRRTQALIAVIGGISVAALSLTTANSAPSTTVLRINSGGGAYTDSRGLNWSPDSYYKGGHAHEVVKPIANTKDDELFQTERWGNTSYSLPLNNGKYQLKLYFAEINPSSGKRVITVKNGSRTLLNNYNVAEKFGSFASHAEVFVVTVTNGRLPLSFTASSNSASIAGIEAVRYDDTRPALAPTTTVPTSSTPTTAKPTPTTAKPTPTPTTAKPSTPSGWKLVASDEFDGNSVSKAKWGVYEGRGNEGVGWRIPAHVTQANGALKILGEGNSGGGAAFQRSQTYGRFEIRAKQDWGQGYGPAVLLWPDSERWPQDGEIDIMEMPDGNRKSAVFTLHWGADNKTTGEEIKGDFTQWHTWTLEWMPDHITLWVDGVQKAHVTDRAQIPDGSMHLAVQNDVGANGHWIPARNSSTPSQVSLHVDYVRIYQKS